MLESFNTLADAFAVLDEEGRDVLMEEVSRIHGMSLSLYVMFLCDGHKEHDCNLKFPKRVAEDYIALFEKDVLLSLSKTCEANGVLFTSDPNEKLRKELLNE